MGKVTVETIKLSRLPKTAKFQVRKKGLLESHVERMESAYRRWLETGGECPVPKPVLFRLGSVFHTVDGHHRVAGMLKAGVAEAEFEVHDGFSEDDAWEYADEANARDRSLPLDEDSTKEAVLRAYERSKKTKLRTDQSLADQYGKHRTTVARWLKAHDPSRAEQTERVGDDGRTHKVNAKSKAKEPDADLFAPENTDSGPRGDTAPRADARPPEVVVPAGPVRPSVPSPENRPERKAGEYPPDERFMPNAAEAAKLAAAFRSVVARMTAVRSEMKAILPDPQHPIANRMHLHTTFLPRLAELIEDVVANTPTHTCPRCAGTTVKADGTDCRECGGYGLVAAGDADQMKGAWAKGSGEWYDRLVREADLTEAMA